MCVATESALVVKLAVVIPAVVLSAPVPSVVTPSLNVTVPVGVPAPGLETITVAVKVSGWPNTGEATEAIVDVVVASCPIVSSSAEAVLAESSISPLYTAVIECVATASDVVVNVAVVTPSVVLSVPVPRVVEPSSNVTVPVGVPALGLEAATVAMNVSD
jgi:hypothetical protein